MVINFERLEIYADVAHTECIVQDVRRDFANVIYAHGRGIECLSLAMKIFNSKGEVDYTDSEMMLIRMHMPLCSPAFIDAINQIINI